VVPNSLIAHARAPRRSNTAFTVVGCGNRVPANTGVLDYYPDMRVDEISMTLSRVLRAHTGRGKAIGVPEKFLAAAINYMKENMRVQAGGSSGHLASFKQSQK
jgi:hypothetical protein